MKVELKQEKKSGHEYRIVWLNVQSIHASSLAMLNFRAAENHCAFVHDLAVVAVAPSSSTPTTSTLEDDIFYFKNFFSLPLVE